MKIKDQINTNNLHHAYLLEGDRGSILADLFSVLEKLKIKTSGNPDFYNVELDTFKIDDARNLKSMTNERSFASDEAGKKVFVISANSFLLEAQNSLLKVFEEPIPNTHFFIIAPSSQIFIPTLLSRFYVIKNDYVKQDLTMQPADEFIKMPLVKRLEFLKDLLASDDDEDNEQADSPRAKALKFLNELETALHAKKVSRTTLNIFEQIFQVRKYLRQPGSSAKSLMESVALSIPPKL